MIKMEILKGFEKYLQERDISGKTIKDYITDVRLFIKFVENVNQEFKPDYITKLMTTGYKKYMIYEKGYKASTINRKITSIECFCKYLIKEGYIITNPADELETVPKQQLAPKSLKRVEIIRLFNLVYAINNKRDICIFSIIYNTGIRNGELARLKLRNIKINERSGVIHIENSKRYRSRIISLNKDVRNAIKEYLEVRPRVKEGEEQPLLVGERGFMTTSGIYRVVKKYGDMINIHLTPHMLRHTFIRNLLDMGVDPVTVSEITGDSLEMLKIYGKPHREHIERAVESIEVSNLIANRKDFNYF